MRLFTVALLSGLCLGPMWESSASAQWFGKKAATKPEPASPASAQGFAGYIRRLATDARAAAERGDLQTARALAERAHKISLTCKPMLVHDPDCSPQAIEGLLKQFGATPAQAATIAQAPTASHVDLAPLLDSSAKEDAVPLPPSPAPPLAGRPVQKARVTPSDASPRTMDSHQKARNSSQSQSSPGFLALQTDWLSPDADSHKLIEKLSEQPSRAPAAKQQTRHSSKTFDSTATSPRKSRRTPPSTVAPLETPEVAEEHVPPEADEPEVTNALGRAGNRWQLDVETSQVDFPEDSAPQLAPHAAPSDEFAHAPADDSRIGVWSSGADAARRGTHVVSLSDFLDPSAHAGRTVTSIDDDAPRMIETDFRQSSATPIPTEPRGGSAATLTAQANGPVVSYRDGPAVGWLSSAAPAEAPASEPAKSFQFEISWPEWTATRKAVVAGMALLIAGLALFGLSFRWT